MRGGVEKRAKIRCSEPLLLAKGCVLPWPCAKPTFAASRARSGARRPRLRVVAGRSSALGQQSHIAHFAGSAG
uniref:Uncharacterized protein n=1 Tax=Tanacetum cinerariifolium TaxID=118510 RepID=A0A699UHS1_TANCI|nr:hypothetical protein [Tanacetum cinerariifolium]